MAAEDVQGPDEVGTVDDPADLTEPAWLGDDDARPSGEIPAHWNRWGEESEDGEAEDQAAAGADEPDAEGTTEAETEDAAAAQPATAPQTKPVHPDNVDVAAMTDAEYVQWATANPEAARRMSMRWSDYSDKNAERNRAQEQLERDRADLEARMAALEEQSRAPQQPEPEPSAAPQQPLSLTPAEATKVYEDLTAQLGRPPNDTEFLGGMVSFEVRRQMQEQVQPIQQTLEEQRRAAEEQAYAEMRDRVNAEYDRLVAEFPQASAPQVRQELAEFCGKHQMGAEPGDLRRAFIALYHDDLQAATQQGRVQARQKQAAASQGTPTLGPGAMGVPPMLPPTTDMDEITRRQRARMLAGEI